MEILGLLGIDTKLLIAQIVNFGLLLWVLNKFLYTPIISHIEKNEEQLKKSEKQKADLEKQIAEFEKQKQMQLIDIKKQALDIIHESELIAKKIEAESKHKIQKDIEKLISQSKNHVKTTQNDLKNSMSKEIHNKLLDTLKDNFNNNLSRKQKIDIQNIFWDSLLDKINNMKLPQSKEPELDHILKKLSAQIDSEVIDITQSKKIASDMYSQNLNPIELQYVYPITSKQEKDLKEILTKKMGFKTIFSSTQNQTLINGFRFEIAGYILASNLLDILIHEAKKEN